MDANAFKRVNYRSKGCCFIITERPDSLHKSAIIFNAFGLLLGRNYSRGASEQASERINESSTERDGENTSISSVYFRNVLHTRRRKCNVSLMCLHYTAVYRYLDACVKAFYEMKYWKDIFAQLPYINEHLRNTTRPPWCGTWSAAFYKISKVFTDDRRGSESFKAAAALYFLDGCIE